MFTLGLDIYHSIAESDKAVNIDAVHNIIRVILIHYTYMFEKYCFIICDSRWFPGFPIVNTNRHGCKVYAHKTFPATYWN